MSQNLSWQSPREGDNSCKIVFVASVIGVEIKGNAYQMVLQDVKNFNLQEKSDHVCLNRNMSEILTLKTLTSIKRY